ncbi:hypothetical protein DPMN_110776 [Dreissena polymorpha]|uniref:Uncharacterized protein n=1 Tax=Dreissena polymorpha TaxID=45954 RepID=A0A9D4QNC5_DREPO|nr:hypothetical protein DPMN_110776 [Dreissena polymorpha]
MMSVRRLFLIFLQVVICVHSIVLNGSYPGENDTFISALVEEYRSLCPYTDTCYFEANHMNLSQYSIATYSCCKACFCSDSCGNACCPDRLNARLSEDEFARIKHEKCVYPQFRQFDWTSSNAESSYIMVSRCPSEYHDVNGTRMKCEKDYHDFDFNDSFEMFLPRSSLHSKILSGSYLNYTVTYKNGHCAVCHGAAQAFILWRPMQACLSPFDFGFVFNNPKNISRFVKSKPNCNVIFEFPKEYNVDPASCVLMIDKCNMTGNWRGYDPNVEEACLSYESVYKGEYKNVHCFMCNGYEKAEIDDYCYWPDSKVPSEPVSYTALLFFMAKEKMTKDYSETPSNDESYLDYSETSSNGETYSDNNIVPSDGDARCSSKSVYDQFMVINLIAFVH